MEHRLAAVLAADMVGYSRLMEADDGVNIAARVEQLADIGGVCATAAVHGQVDGRLDVVFEDLGEKLLKNISRPVRLYRIVPEAAEGGKRWRPIADRSLGDGRPAARLRRGMLRLARRPHRGVGACCPGARARP